MTALAARRNENGATGRARWLASPSTEGLTTWLFGRQPCRSARTEDKMAPKRVPLLQPRHSLSLRELGEGRGEGPFVDCGRVYFQSRGVGGAGRWPT